ncbi:MAG TPA: DUF2933 domain-containing protein [Acetobacteraceae bacterium]|nr:DUF2933 domain-containing protein [Acetobacteraceae bacterium]
MDHGTNIPPWRTKGGVVLCGFLAIAAFFLIAEHRAHLVLAVPYLPWLLLLACPLMHLFMHGGHGSHGDHGDSGPPARRD